MNAKAGVVTAQVAWLATAPWLATPDTKEWLFGFVVAGVASYLPDLDHPGSTAGRAVPGILQRLFRWACGGHRMLAHSALAVLGVWWLTQFLLEDQTIADSAAVGYSAHIFTDMLTVQGVGLLYGFGLPFLLAGKVLAGLGATRLGKTLVRIGRAFHRKTQFGWMTTGSIHEERYVTWVQRLGMLLLVTFLLLLASRHTVHVDTKEVQQRWEKFSGSLVRPTNT